jgi:hypothetical protein
LSWSPGSTSPFVPLTGRIESKSIGKKAAKSPLAAGIDMF